MSETADDLNEANRDVILRLIADGDDLSKARDIDFTVVFPNGAAAEEFASKLRQEGYAASVDESDTAEGLPWDVVVVKHMLPICEAITEFQLSLQAEALSLGGRNDGWGCFAQKPSNQH
jgi:hypothetical protein